MSKDIAIDSIISEVINPYDVLRELIYPGVDLSRKTRVVEFQAMLAGKSRKKG